MNNIILLCGKKNEWWISHKYIYKSLHSSWNRLAESFPSTSLVATSGFNLWNLRDHSDRLANGPVPSRWPNKPMKRVKCSVIDLSRLKAEREREKDWNLQLGLFDQCSRHRHPVSGRVAGSRFQSASRLCRQSKRPQEIRNLDLRNGTMEWMDHSPAKSATTFLEFDWIMRPMLVMMMMMEIYREVSHILRMLNDHGVLLFLVWSFFFFFFFFHSSFRKKKEKAKERRKKIKTDLLYPSHFDRICTWRLWFEVMRSTIYRISYLEDGSWPWSDRWFRYNESSLRIDHRTSKHYMSSISVRY